MRTVCLSLLVFGVLAGPTGAKAQTTSPAQNPPVITLPATVSSASEWGRFETAFAALSEKYQTAFVCESAPFQPTLSPEAAVALQKQVGISSLSKQEAITTVAQAYDYDPVFVDAHTVLLFKRYSKPQDLPEITLDEAALFLNTLLKETEFPVERGDVTAHRLIRTLLNGATDEQKRIYENGVGMAALPVDFQKRFGFALAEGPLMRFTQRLGPIAQRLNVVQQKKEVIVKTLSYSDVPYSAVEGPFRLPLSPDLEEVILSEFLRKPPVEETVSKPSRRLPTQTPKAVKPPFDPTTPTEEELTTQPKPLLACQKTLGEVADALNLRLSQKGENQNRLVRVEIPGPIRQKTVSLFGAEHFLSPLQQVKAIAQVLGLRGVQGGDGVARIVLPQARSLNAPSEISNEIERLMPASLLRALIGGKKTETGNSNSSPPLSKIRRIDPFAAAAIYTQSVRQLRRIVEPRLSTNGNAVPFTDFSEAAQNLFALASLTDDVHLFRADIYSPLFSAPNELNRATFKFYRTGSFSTYEFQIPNGQGGTSGGTSGSSSSSMP